MDFTDEIDKHLHGTIHYNKIQVEGNSARNDYDFRNKESLEEAKQDILEKIKICRNNKTRIALLDEAISTNKKVLEADYQFLMHYLKHHLNTENLTMDLLESNQTVKNLHDLVERHGKFGNFLAKQIKQYKIIQQEQVPDELQKEHKLNLVTTGKPWESNYNIVVNLCNGFDIQAQILVKTGYIDENSFEWKFDKASKSDLAQYFKRIKKVGKGKQFWRYVAYLFGLAKTTDEASTVAETLKRYANKKYENSATLNALLQTVGLIKTSR